MFSKLRGIRSTRKRIECDQKDTLWETNSLASKIRLIISDVPRTNHPLGDHPTNQVGRPRAAVDHQLMKQGVFNYSPDP